MLNTLPRARLALALAPLLAILSGGLAVVTPGSAAASPAVVTDIGPIDSIAARIMAGVGTPEPILPAGADPHSYSLRPSEARRLGEADLVIWIGPGMTPWLADPLDALAGGARVLTLDALPGLTLLPVRASGPFERSEHDHGSEEHDAEHDDGHGHDHEHGPEDEAQEHDGSEDDGQAHEAHAHGGHDTEDHGRTPAGNGLDQHLWLDPANAIVFAEAVAAELAALDPENAGTYRANAAEFRAEIGALEAEVSRILSPVRGKPFIVFHDAYQYFEHRFDMPAAGSVALHDGEAPGAARVAEIRERVIEDKIVCAFSEPQFPPRLLATITEGTDVRGAALDPEGVGLAPGPELYPTLIRTLATDLAACLEG